MSLLFVKVALAPLIVLIASLLGRRLGPHAAGVFVGLPGTALPFLLTMYLMHGTSAAVATATGGVTGQLTCVAFCIADARTAPRMRPIAAVLAAITVAIGLSFTTLALDNPYVTGELAIGAILIGLRTWPQATERATPASDRWWAIPLRMVLATLTIVTLASLEPLLGTLVAGALASLPTILMVLGVADHWTRGPRPTVDLAGGTLSSIAGTLGFLLVIVSLTAHIGVWWALLLGLAVIPVLNRAVPALSARMPELTWRRAFSGGRLAQAPIR